MVLGNECGSAIKYDLALHFYVDDIVIKRGN